MRGGRIFSRNGTRANNRSGTSNTLRVNAKRPVIRVPVKGKGFSLGRAGYEKAIIRLSALKTKLNNTRGEYARQRIIDAIDRIEIQLDLYEGREKVRAQKRKK